MTKQKRFWILSLLTLLLAALFATFAFASEERESEVLTVSYPDGTVQTFAEGEAVTAPAVPSDFLVFEDGKAYKYTVTGAEWTYSEALPATVRAEHLGKTITADIAGEKDPRQVYYTSLEELDSKTTLVYHMKNDVHTYFSMSNTGDRGDGTNTGATDAETLRQQTTKRVVVKLYEDVTCSNFPLRWYGTESTRVKGRPVYFDLNGHTVTTTQTDYIDCVGAELHIYSSVPGAHWYQTNARRMFRPNNDFTLYLGDDGSGNYTDNISFHGKSILYSVHGNGAYIDGGRYYQTGASSTGGFIELGRRVKRMQNASVYVLEGQAVFACTDAANSSTVLTGTISNCNFYAPSESPTLVGSVAASTRFSGCSFVNVRMDTAIGTSTALSYAAGNYTNLPMRANVGKSTESIWAVKDAVPKTVSLSMADGTQMRVALDYHTAAVAGGLTVTYEDGESEIRLIGEPIVTRSAPMTYTENGVLYAKTAEISTVTLANGTVTASETVTDAMAGTSATITQQAVYAPALFSVAVGEDVTYYTNEETYAADLAAYLAAMDAGATVTLYKDVTLPPITVAGKRIADKSTAENATYALDLAGHTLTFGGSGLAMNVCAPGFYLYSSVSGAEVIAEEHTLFATAEDNYKWIGGEAYGPQTSTYESAASTEVIAPQGFITLAASADASLGENITFICNRINSDMHGAGAQILGGTFVQSEMGASPYFLLLSRLEANTEHIRRVENATFVITNADTAPLFYRVASGMTFAACRFVCTAGSAAPLFAEENTLLPTNPIFDGCDFYDVLPARNYGCREITYTDCAFGFSGAVPAEDLDPTEAVAYLRAAAAKSLTVLGESYTLDQMLYVAPYEKVTVIYPDGARVEYQVGDTVAHYAMADTKTENGSFYKLCGSAWTYSLLGEALPDAVIPAEAAGKNIIATGYSYSKVYYTTREELASGTVLVYHLRDDLDVYFSKENLGDRGDGTNLGAASYQDLRLESTKKVVVTLYEDMAFDSFAFDWCDADNRIGGRPVYLNLNGHTISLSQTNFVSIIGIKVYIYSSAEGAEFRMSEAKQMFRSDDDGALYLGSNAASGTYKDNISFYGRSLFGEMYGSGAFIYGGHYYQTEPAAVFVEISRRVRAVQNASFYLCDGSTALFGVTKKIDGTTVANGSPSITDCYFYAPDFAYVLYATQAGAAPTYSNCTFDGIETDVMGDSTVIVYPDGTEQNYILGDTITPLRPVENYTDGNGRYYHLTAVRWIFTDENGAVITDTEISNGMLGKTYTATADHVYERVYYTVTVGENTFYNTNGEGHAVDLQIYLSSIEPGAIVKLYADISMQILRVTNPMGRDAAVLNSASHYLDLAGHTLTFEGSGGIAFDVRVHRFYLYSSVEGGRILAQKHALYTTSAKEYTTRHGANTTVHGTVCIGEADVSSSAYGKNLTVICRSINTEEQSGGAYLLGATFVQSTDSVAEQMLAVTDAALHAIKNINVILTNPATTVILYRNAQSIQPQGCNFICTADTATSLFNLVSTSNTATNAFDGCSFYNVIPAGSLSHLPIAYTDCAFGFRGGVPEDDLDAGVGEAYLTLTQSRTVTVLGCPYVLSYMLCVTAGEGCTVLYPDGTEQTHAVGTVIHPHFSSDAFVGKDGLFYSKTADGWSFLLDGVALSDLTVTEDMVGKTLIATGYDRVYFTVEVDGAVTYYTNASTYASDFRNYLTAMDQGATVTMHSDITIAPLKVCGKRGPNASVIQSASYWLDIGGYTLSFTGSSTAMTFQTANFYLYSSVPGGEIRAEKQAFFITDNDDYKWNNGNPLNKGSTGYENSTETAITPFAVVYIGERSAAVSEYGQNLTVHCASVNTTMYGTGVYFLGGTFVQSESSTQDYFFLLSRTTSKNPHIKSVSNTTFVLRNASTEFLYYYASTAVTFTRCNFVHTSGTAVNLFAPSNTTFPSVPKFVQCNFYDVIPKVTAATSGAASYSNCKFGFSGDAPTGDLDSGAATAFLSPMQPQSITVLSQSYAMCYSLILSESGFCTVVYPDGSYRVFYVGELLVPITEQSSYFADGILYADLGSGWSFLVDGAALADLTVTENMAGKTVSAVGYGRAYFSVTVGERTIYYTDADTYASDLAAYLGAMDQGATIMMYADATIPALTVRGKRIEDGALAKSAEYRFDLNGYTLTFTGTGIAMNICAPNFFFYSSVPGGCAIAETHTFFRSDNDDYKWIGGAAYGSSSATYKNDTTGAVEIKPMGVAYIGEASVTTESVYGENLTVICAQAGGSMFGDGGYFLGGTFVQSESSTAVYFAAISRMNLTTIADGMYNTTFVITKPETRFLSKDSTAAAQILGCTFVSMAGEASELFLASNTAPQLTFKDCRFYDATPAAMWGNKTVVYTDCLFGFTGMTPLVDGLLIAHSAETVFAFANGTEYALDHRIASDLSEVCTVIWGEEVREYWMLGTIPQCNASYLDTVVEDANGTAIAKRGAIIDANDIRTVNASMLGTEYTVSVSYLSEQPLAFSYTDAEGRLFFVPLSAGMSTAEIGDLFHQTFDQCDGAYTIKLHADLSLSKGLGWGPLGTVDETKPEYKSLKNGSVTLDLNGFTLTVEKNCAGINASNSNSANYPAVGYGIFAFEINSDATFTLTSSRPGARIDNLSSSAFIAVGEQASLNVVIEGENLTVNSVGAIIFSYETVTSKGANFTINGGEYHFSGNTVPFAFLGTATVSDANIYMTGSPVAAFGVHYWKRSSSLTLVNSFVYSKNTAPIFSFISSKLQATAATMSSGVVHSLAIDDCAFVGITLPTAIENVSSLVYTNVAIADEQTLLSLYGGTAPADTILAYVQRKVDGVAYRLVAYLPAEKIGVVDWGYGIPTEYWRLGEYATRSNAVVGGLFGYVFGETLVDSAVVRGNATLAALRPGTLQMSLTLQGQIGLNLYLLEAVGASSITVAGVSYDLSSMKAEGGYYHFIASVSPNLADREISVVIAVGNYEHAASVSIERYASALLASNQYAKAHDLTYAMVEHIEAQTGTSFTSCSVPEGYELHRPVAAPSSNGAHTLLKGITFRLDGTIAVAILGVSDTNVNLVLSTGRSEHAKIAASSAIFEEIYINEFFGDMKIYATREGVTESYTYSLENYLYYQKDAALIEKVEALYNYTYHAHLYVDSLSPAVLDENGDHLCDICGKTKNSHTDVEDDGLCDLCGLALPWSDGLTFAENADGGYTLIGRGDCADSVITVPDTYLGKPVTAIGEGALRGASDVTAVILPNSVRTVAASAFASCDLMQSIRFGDATVSIGENAFAGCESLSAVYFHGRATSWSAISIAATNTALTEATVYFYSESLPKTDGHFWHFGESGGVVIHCADFNRDHLCDACGKTMTACEDPNRDHACDRCGAVISSHADTDKNHLCDVCSVTLSTCRDTDIDHLCDLCGTALSECVNTNGDHLCDVCGATVTACVDTSGDHLCDLCGEKASECLDADGDHFCDICSKTVSVCRDANSDHFCDSCLGRLSRCGDNNADHLCDLCSQALSVCEDADFDHACDLCGKNLGDCEDLNGDHLCDSCQKTFSVCADADEDHVCDVCGADLPCLDLNGDHICEICGERAAECTDTDGDHLCDLCGARLSVCADTDKDHLCDLCGTTLTECVDEDRDHLCDLCKETVGACADTNADHLCDLCGVTISVCRDNGNQLCALCGRVLASEGLLYSKNADGTYTVVGMGECKDTYVYVPKLYNGAPVTAIANGAFSANRRITGISVPDSVTRIGVTSFIACVNLKDVVIGDGVTEVAFGAFALCTSLESVKIGDGVENIGLGAFSGCTSLAEVSFGRGLRVISLGAFSGCVSLTEIDLPDGLQTIGLGAFSGCQRLQTVHLPKTVTRVGYGAFSGCESLTSVYYDGTADAFASIDISYKNRALIDADIYHYTATEPAGQGRYWYYDESGAIIAVTLCPAHTDENHNCVCDFCAAILECEHSLDADGYCEWCNFFICAVHRDTDHDLFCDLCGAEVTCESHADTDGDGICDYCNTAFTCENHADADGDGVCDACDAPMESEDFPWQTDTVTFKISNHSGGGILSSRAQSFMAGEIILADSATEQAILERNAEAYAATRIAVAYSYRSEFDDAYAWSRSYERINVDQARGIYSDIYCDFAYDMMGASLLGCFANLKTETQTNYFAFASDPDYAATVGDADGYMYTYMESIAFDEDRMYLLASDYFIDTVRAFYCVPVNVAMLNDLAENDILGLGRANTVRDLTDAVQSGAWTYELMMRYAAVYGDVSEDSDAVGLALTESSLCAAGLLYSSSVSLYENASADSPYVSPEENDTLYNFTNALQGLANASGVLRYGEGSRLAVRERFTSDGALFGGVVLLGDLEASAYRNMSEGVLILPVPVYMANATYSTAIADVGRVGAISIKTEKFAQCSAFLDYQSTHSAAVLASYFENDLLHAAAEEDVTLLAENLAMLDLMRASVGGARDQMLENAIAIFYSHRTTVGVDGETSYTDLRWQEILSSEHYTSTYVRAYHTMLREQKDAALAAIYRNGNTMLPR